MFKRGPEMTVRRGRTSNILEGEIRIKEGGTYGKESMRGLESRLVPHCR